MILSKVSIPSTSVPSGSVPAGPARSRHCWRSVAESCSASQPGTFTGSLRVALRYLHKTHYLAGDSVEVIRRPTRPFVVRWRGKAGQHQHSPVTRFLSPDLAAVLGRFGQRYFEYFSKPASRVRSMRNEHQRPHEVQQCAENLLTPLTPISVFRRPQVFTHWRRIANHVCFEKRAHPNAPQAGRETIKVFPRWGLTPICDQIVELPDIPPVAVEQSIEILIVRADLFHPVGHSLILPDDHHLGRAGVRKLAFAHPRAWVLPVERPGKLADFCFQTCCRSIHEMIVPRGSAGRHNQLSIRKLHGNWVFGARSPGAAMGAHREKVGRPGIPNRAFPIY